MEGEAPHKPYPFSEFKIRGKLIIHCTWMYFLNFLSFPRIKIFLSTSVHSFSSHHFINTSKLSVFYAEVNWQLLIIRKINSDVCSFLIALNDLVFDYRPKYSNSFRFLCSTDRHASKNFIYIFIGVIIFLVQINFLEYDQWFTPALPSWPTCRWRSKTNGEDDSPITRQRIL